ncbi:MAG: hypothetical protein EZS28_034543 [Streblomastix strix]|uniref:Inositol polyphosphate-related phosphatase domain-containing protein n=1 Tax=Streblomastix strix TaxID=222440 RepID=A0A5J4UIR5_9EUKA|nr:MAG: hypothetical protein EZS28_034543 [Streblomastix strix]
MCESFFDKLSQSCIPANKHDYCFLMGDLNLEINSRRSFDEFEEMKITWGPTYRFNVGSHAFDTRLGTAVQSTVSFAIDQSGSRPIIHTPVKGIAS